MRRSETAPRLKTMASGTKTKLLAALEQLMSGEMRRIFANNRTNARGASCSRKLDKALSLIG